MNRLPGDPGAERSRLHDLLHSCATRPNLYEISSVLQSFEFLYPTIIACFSRFFPESPQAA